MSLRTLAQASSRLQRDAEYQENGVPKENGAKTPHQFSEALRQQSLEPTALGDLSAFIHEHMHEKRPLPRLARGLGMSTRTLSRACIGRAGRVAGCSTIGLWRKVSSNASTISAEICGWSATLWEAHRHPRSLCSRSFSSTSLRSARSLALCVPFALRQLRRGDPEDLQRPGASFGAERF